MNLEDPIPRAKALRNRWLTWPESRFGRFNFQRDEHIDALTELIVNDRPPAVAVLSGERGIGRGYLCEAAAQRARDGGHRVAVWHLDLDGFEPDGNDPLHRYLEHMLDEQEREGNTAHDQTRSVLMDFGVEFAAALSHERAGLGAVLLSLWLQFRGEAPIDRLAKQMSGSKGGGSPQREPVEALNRFVAALSADRFLVIHVTDGPQLPRDLRRWLTREAEGAPQRILLAITCLPEEATDRVAPDAQHAPERIDLEPLNTSELRTLLDRRFAPNAFPVDLAPALIRCSHGRPVMVASLIADLIEAEVLEQHGDTWRLPTAGLESENLAKVLSSTLFEEVGVHLAEVTDIDMRRILSKVLVLAALCGRYVPIALPFALLELDEETADAVIDWLDDVMVAELGWLEDLEWRHAAFPGYNIYSFTHPVLPHTVLDRLAKSDYERQGTAVELLRFLEHQNVPVVRRGMARMFLNIAEHLDERDREPYLRQLAWWVDLGAVEILREEVRTQIERGEVDSEVVWRVANNSKAWLPHRRLALLDAYAEAEIKGEDHELVSAIPFERLGTFHLLRADLLIRGVGRYGEGLEDALRALSLADQDISKRVPALNSCGMGRIQLGKYAAAQANFEEALSLGKELYGRAHPNTLTLQMNLARTLQAQGDFASARELEEQVVDAFTRLLGPEHPNTLMTRSKLAMTLCDQGDFGSARKLLEPVLKAQRRLLGTKHPDTLRSVEMLAKVLRELGEDEQADRVHEL